MVRRAASFDAPSDAGLTAVFGPLHGLDGVVANGARAAMTSAQARPMDTHDLSAVMVSPHVKFVHRYISFSCESGANASHVIDDMIRRLPDANHVRHVTLAEYGPDPEHGRRFMCLVVLHKVTRFAPLSIPRSSSSNGCLPGCCRCGGVERHPASVQACVLHIVR